ncbi:2373_t:CDS:2, partial [Funneliformis geosporum]
KEKSKEPYCLDCGEDENKQGKMFEDIKDDFFVFQETNKLIEEYLLEFAKEEEQKTNRTPEEEQELENLRKKLRELEKRLNQKTEQKDNSKLILGLGMGVL